MEISRRSQKFQSGYSVYWLHLLLFYPCLNPLHVLSTYLTAPRSSYSPYVVVSPSNAGLAYTRQSDPRAHQQLGVSRVCGHVDSEDNPIASFEIRKYKRACMDDNKDLAFWPAYDSLNLDKEKQGVLDGSITRHERPVIWVELARLRSSSTQTDCWKVLKGILCSLSQQYAYLLTSFVETTIPTSIAHQAEANRRKPRRCIPQHRVPSRLRRRRGRAHQSPPLQAQIPHDYGYVTCKVAIQHHSTSSSHTSRLTLPSH